MTEPSPRAPNRVPGRMPNRVLRRVLVVLRVLIGVPVVAAVTLLVAVRPPAHDFAPEPWTPGLGFDIDPTVSAPVEAVAATDELFGPEDIAIDSSGTSTPVTERHGLAHHARRRDDRVRGRERCSLPLPRYSAHGGLWQGPRRGSN